VRVEVPVHFINHELAPGLKRGGSLNIVYHSVEMWVPADNIPEAITGDLAGLDFNDSLHISAFTLPQGCKPTNPDKNFTVASLAPPLVAAADAAALERKYDLVLTESQFKRWLGQLEAADLIAFDTETTSLDYMQAEIVGVSFCVEPGHAAYVPLAHTYPGAPKQLGREHVLGTLKPLLEDASRAKLGHHPNTTRTCSAITASMRGMKFDSMLESTS
jgi:hypothetical protein